MALKLKHLVEFKVPNRRAATRRFKHTSLFQNLPAHRDSQMWIHFETGQVQYHHQHQKHCRIRLKSSEVLYMRYILKSFRKRCSGHALSTDLSCRPPVFLAIGIEPYLIAIICIQVIRKIQHIRSKHYRCKRQVLI